MKNEKKVTSESIVESMKAIVNNVLQKKSRRKAEQEALFTLFQATTYMSDNVDDVTIILGISSK